MAQVKPGVFALAVILVVVGVAAAPVLASTAEGGTELWAKRYNGSSSSDNGVSVAASPDGLKVFVTGSSIGSTGNFDMATIAYDAITGVELWTRRFTGSGSSDDLAYSVAVSPDSSKVFVTGSTGPTGNYDYATIAYNATTGANVWFKDYNGPGNSTDIATSLVVSPDGSKVYVTGGSVGSGSGSDYVTIAYNATTGANVWFKDYNGPGDGDDVASSVAVSPDGSNVFVTGGSVGSGSGSDYVTIAYNATTGANVWFKDYKGPGNGGDFAYSIAVSPDSSKVFVTGSATGSTGNYDYATIAYNAATGANVWFKDYDGPGNGDDVAYSVAVSPDGSKVFVTGGALSSTDNWDYVTIAYAAVNGANLWVSRYNGPGNDVDYASSAAASPGSSKVFVTGSSTGSGTSFDYATIAYQA